MQLCKQDGSEIHGGRKLSLLWQVSRGKEMWEEGCRVDTKQAIEMLILSLWRSLW